MVIRHNMNAMFADRSSYVSSSGVDKSMEKLSSGIRINRAGDDAAGLSVSEKMRNQIRGLNRAASNAVDGISFIQLSEGYLQETSNILHRIRELAVQAANGIYTDDDRKLIQVEVSQMVDEVNRIASHAQFNGYNIFTGRFASGEYGEPTGSMWFHLGANANQSVRVYIATMTAAGLGLSAVDGSSPLLLTNTYDANRAIENVDIALKTLNKQRADLGAYQNRMEELVGGLSSASINLQSAESYIRDTDYAENVVNLTKDQILNESGTAMLAQANQNGANVLRLLS